MAFQFTPVPNIPGLVLIEPKVFGDGRGWFAEMYKASDFVSNGIDVRFVQISHSKSASVGTIRGLHFQREPYAQGKLVRCIRGKVFDVAVDIRGGSSSFGKHAAFELSEDNKKLFWIPPGFAHGFCALSEGAEIEYYMTNEYRPDSERSLQWNDPTVGVAWPTSAPVLSVKDSGGVLLGKLDSNFTYSK